MSFQRFDARAALRHAEGEHDFAPNLPAETPEPALAELAALAETDPKPGKADADRDADFQASVPLAANSAKPAKAPADDLAERAAIIEYDGNVPRDWAEGFAQLDPDRPPLDVPAARWLQFIDDIGRFLDGGFAAQASALGWGPLDLFGCGDTKPFARIDLSGLLWLLAGDRLVALTADTATIEARSGARTTYRRRAGQPGRVLAWELAP